MSVKYDDDYYLWSLKQAEYFEERKFDMLDLENLIEELISLGNSQYSKLESHLIILFMHMLKCKYQPGKHTRSWDLSIKGSTYHAKRTLQQNPGLKHKMDEIVKDAYYSAGLEAAKETGLDEKIFPEECPWDILEILQEGTPPPNLTGEG